MKQAKIKLSKTIIIKTTLELINEKQGSSFVTIREIAKKLNCSHPNIYNYYNSVDMLLWDCLENVMLKMIDTVLISTSIVQISDKLKTFFEKLLDFYLNNKGWYNLIWFDHIKGQMPDNIKKIINKPRQEFCIFLQEIYPNYNLTPIAENITDTIHSYIHGQVSRIISGRIFIQDQNAIKKHIILTSIELVDLYIKAKGIKNEKD
jgi:AcrR family transcriptional regulator